MYTSTGVDRRESPSFYDQLRKANELRFHESYSVEYAALERKPMKLSHPASHRTCLRQTVIIMDGFNLKRHTSSQSHTNQYNLRGILRVRRHRTAREAKLVKENRHFLHIPSWDTKTPCCSVHQVRKRSKQSFFFFFFLASLFIVQQGGGPMSDIYMYGSSTLCIYL